MTFILCLPEQTIIEEIRDPDMKQRDVAMTYRLAMEAEQHGKVVDWSKVNALIIQRWSKSGLKRIKEMAWKGVY